MQQSNVKQKLMKFYSIFQTLTLDPKMINIVYKIQTVNDGHFTGGA